MSSIHTNLPLVLAKGTSNICDSESLVPTAPPTPLKHQPTTASRPRPLKRATPAPFPLDLGGTLFSGMGDEVNEVIEFDDSATQQYAVFLDHDSTSMDPAADDPISLEFDAEYFKTCKLIRFNPATQGSSNLDLLFELARWSGGGITKSQFRQIIHIHGLELTPEGTQWTNWPPQLLSSLVDALVIVLPSWVLLDLDLNYLAMYWLGTISTFVAKSPSTQSHPTSTSSAK
ncbi:hypothetical protein FA13DRAFT_1798648 [Coprinellus micaceus]|uniref:Uncharacterized protein n=1 Tax=Coprinellus micaceus TaxID=71717 RepID=A0A4Y7SN25_COPMI|nr:hypothetical protein FA13DRAFT_1798648 [Coprinellus micaceus]